MSRYGLDPTEFPVLVHVTPGIGSSTHPFEANSTIGTGLNGIGRDAKDSDIVVPR